MKTIFKVLGALVLLMISAFTISLAQGYEIQDWQWWILMSPVWLVFYWAAVVLEKTEPYRLKGE